MRFYWEKYAIAPAVCPGGYKTNKACKGLGGNSPPECKDYIGPDKVNGKLVKYTKCKHIIVKKKGSSWCCPP
uniref:Uncharacterized protein n=1 Tax=Meloidogyne incognita TaxID=6306 RepID=A0A914NN50_MELIC